MVVTKEKSDGFDKYKKELVYQNPKKEGTITRDYILKKVQYIFSNYVRGIDATSYSSRSGFELLRLFAAGKQPEARYQPFFFGQDADVSQSKTFNNAGVDVGGVNDQNFDLS